MVYLDEEVEIEVEWAPSGALNFEEAIGHFE